MIKSMTGYGSATSDLVEVEIKSINSKYLDIKFNMPKELLKYEHQWLQIVSKKLVRGKIIVSIKILSLENQTQYTIDKELFIKNFKIIKDLKKQLQQKKESDIFALTINLPGIINKENNIKIYNANIENIEKAIKEATKKCDENRKKEGSILKNKIIQYLTEIKKHNHNIAQIIPQRIKEIKEKLKEKITLINPDIEINHSRLEQEIVYYANKISIEEEKQRLSYHIKEFQDSINKQTNTTTPIGKKLIFITQEMNRETNTISCKSSNYLIQKASISIKEEIEKIKEQLENIL